MKKQIDQNNQARLIIIKIVHTLVWLFFNAVLGYMAYAIIANKIDLWVWVGVGLFVMEGIVLLCYKMVCPLTIIARRYSGSRKENFDIFLPQWLARNNKRIYTILLGLVLSLLLYRVLT